MHSQSTGPFIITLCRLDAPVSIRPPQSAHLKRFRFFTSRARDRDGSERFYLHMGYFSTATDAETWVRVVRARYPNAVAAVAPAALLPQPAGAPTAATAVPVAATEDPALTDTQVIKILETRGGVPHGDTEEGTVRVPLVRPEDTTTRRILKEAVVAGAPVFFAVQLQWSPERFNLSRMPAIAPLKAHTLYATESRRDGRSRYFLRLGFFSDPMSATDVASEVRAHFLSAAVVPVPEQECLRAREASSDTSVIPHLLQPRVEPGPEATRPAPPPVVKPKPVNETPRRAAPPPEEEEEQYEPEDETLEHTLKELALSETWADPDSFGETGVRHLKVEITERKSRRS